MRLLKNVLDIGTTKQLLSQLFAGTTTDRGNGRLLPDGFAGPCLKDHGFRADGTIAQHALLDTAGKPKLETLRIKPGKWLHDVEHTMPVGVIERYLIAVKSRVLPSGKDALSIFNTEGQHEGIVFFAGANLRKVEAQVKDIFAGVGAFHPHLPGEVSEKDKLGTHGLAFCHGIVR